MPRGRRIGDPLAVGAYRLVAVGALIAEPAGAVAVRKKHDEPGLDELLRPVAVTRGDGSRRIDEPAAIVHGDDGRERAVAVGAVQDALESDFAVANLDRVR